ncbi:MAG: aspartate aminotransferase family protein [Bacteroidia bacterium]|nr:aspartate aminotransferase family protein [Bacteroidia bacterium]
MSILRELFLKHQAQTSPTPVLLEIARAEGVYLFDNEGNQYLDLISGISVSNVGHCAPEVVKAVQNQAATCMHTMVYGEYVLAPPALFAEKLCRELNNDLTVVYFVNSGAEAVEGALKTAKKYTGRHKIVAFHDSYHGSTHGALSVTGNDWIKEGYGPLLPEVKHIHFNDFEDLKQITAETACVIVEPVQAEAGIRLAQAGYFQALRNRCDETGAILILDEIQTGFGRTGTLFAHEQLGIVPDILLLAKGMGGGMPIGAFIGKREIMEVLSHNPILGHITTFGGHPVCTAAGLACLNKILDERLLDSIPAKSRLITEYCTHPKIQSLNGVGMMYAIELDSFENTLRVVQEALRRGVITDWFLNKSNALRIAPPLTITEAELKSGLQILNNVIAEVYA